MATERVGLNIVASLNAGGTIPGPTGLPQRDRSPVGGVCTCKFGQPGPCHASATTPLARQDMPQSIAEMRAEIRQRRIAELDTIIQLAQRHMVEWGKIHADASALWLALSAETGPVSATESTEQASGRGTGRVEDAGRQDGSQPVDRTWG